MKNDDSLTPREREVLALMAAGKTNAEISRELAISFPTAKAHVSSVLAKLEASTREEAVARSRLTGRRSSWRTGWLWAPLAIGAAAVVVLALGVAGVFLLDNSSPERDTTLVIPLEELPNDVPTRFPLQGFGEFEPGKEYGVWVTKSGSGAVTALFDRDPHSGCPVPWLEGPHTLADLGDQSGTRLTALVGAYKDPCGGWTYLRHSGQVVFGASPRGLDSFPVTVEGSNAVVDLTRVQLGLCQEPTTPPSCSREGQPEYVTDPPPPIIPDWGRGSP